MSVPANAATAITKIDPHWKALMECAATEVFSMMAGMELQAYEEMPAEIRGDQTAMVGLAGALCGMITIRCSSATATKLAGALLGVDDPSMTIDAMGELANMVAGNFKSKISQVVDHCMLSIPTVISGEAYTLQVMPPTEGFHLAFRLDDQPIWFSLVVHS
ncbi:MAG TPA: chemotaxis protein CheX [Dongiaceae bacterium]|nr:chemotaxis protein CheX [Dongiaceae bacterium]